MVFPKILSSSLHPRINLASDHFDQKIKAELSPIGASALSLRPIQRKKIAKTLAVGNVFVHVIS